MPNGVCVLAIDAGTQEVTRLELVFDAGTRYQAKPLESRAAISMLTEGTARHTSHQIAEKFDFYGSFIEQANDRDYSIITLYSLNKFFGESLSLLEEVVKQPTYPEKELDTFRTKGKQSLIVDLEKVSTLARQELYRGIYGNSHPYGVFAEPSDFDTLERDGIVQFHSNYLHPGNCTIVIAGKLTGNEIGRIAEAFGQPERAKTTPERTMTTIPANPEQRKLFVFKAEAVQSAIRIGKSTIKRSHPHYPGLMVLNTILGGYFGSRLMKNIREDKGYTYGISSSVIPFRDSGTFIIGAEVGSQFTHEAIAEIYNEMKKLRERPVPAEELELVRGYLLGEVLRNFDGPFAIAESITSLFQHNNLDYDYFGRTIETIKTISPKELQNLANLYLREEEMVECVAGAVSNMP